jgi:hypothetical protein
LLTIRVGSNEMQGAIARHVCTQHPSLGAAIGVSRAGWPGRSARHASRRPSVVGVANPVCCSVTPLERTWTRCCADLDALERSLSIRVVLWVVLSGQQGCWLVRRVGLPELRQSRRPAPGDLEDCGLVVACERGVAWDGGVVGGRDVPKCGRLRESVSGTHRKGRAGSTVYGTAAAVARVTGHAAAGAHVWMDATRGAAVRTARRRALAVDFIAVLTRCQSLRTRRPLLLRQLPARPTVSHSSSPINSSPSQRSSSQSPPRCSSQWRGWPHAAEPEPLNTASRRTPPKSLLPPNCS